MNVFLDRYLVRYLGVKVQSIRYKYLGKVSRYIGGSLEPSKKARKKLKVNNARFICVTCENIRFCSQTCLKAFHNHS